MEFKDINVRDNFSFYDYTSDLDEKAKMIRSPYNESSTLINDVLGKYPRYAIPDNSYDMQYYDPKNIELISRNVTNLLHGVIKDKNIIVPNDTILSVMDSFYQNHPRVSYVVKLKMVIAYIVQQIKNEFETIEQNNKLNVEVIKYTGEYGMRKTSDIKINTNRPNTFIFNMRY